MTHEDAISRENLLLWLDDIKESARKHVGFLLDVQRYIRSMPSVTPQQKTGYWIRELIRNEKGGCIGAKRICSRCGKDNKHDEYMKYCPNCGAKMEVEE